MKAALTYFALACLFALHPARADTVTVSGDQRLEPVRLKRLATDSVVDLTRADFHVAISRNRSPDRERPCQDGTRRVNRYPMAIEDSAMVRILGGRFNGTVPMTSDWRWTYCNSAALRVERSVGARIEDQRIRRAWDAIRIDDGSRDFLIDGVWLTSIRDDCVENDKMLSGVIRDSLFDRCFAGISMASTRTHNRKPQLVLSGVLMRLQSFLYKGEVRHALPFKMDEKAAMIDISDSVIAVETEDLVGGKYAALMWQSIGKCSNNLLLWMKSTPVPPKLRSAPKCFRVLQGQAARDAWSTARQNWIDCHPKARRFPDDPRSNSSRCDRGRFGGFGE